MHLFDICAGQDFRYGYKMPQQSIQIYQRLWNEFDPIGVSKVSVDWNPRTDLEYLSYARTTAKFLQANADSHRLRKFVSASVYGDMGINRSDRMDDRIANFVALLVELS